MKTKKLYDHITAHMTAEQALMKLLEGSLLQYEKLKFDTKNEPVHPLIIISMAACDMGWDMAIKNGGGDMTGICIGTKEYMEEIFPSKK